ncbi:glycerate dehydrogenase HPR, peroxisomal-like [Zingiber officinale]|uniref:glycerate dehydrogenase HPR, peroxisomal-like n=1 Tax=Zingiber officinale TaxID=94328 RepID=UPI001C4C8EEB|nr:glycerate dehydrogenase HPR, peroxisomal-like [Zingiber officinale]
MVEALVCTSDWLRGEEINLYKELTEDEFNFYKDCEEVITSTISLHPVLDKTTYHLINKETLAIVKKEAILVNASRGPVIDEAALVEHLKANPMFSVGLNVFEDEPKMKPGLAEQKNAIVVPHIASASKSIVDV